MTERPPEIRPIFVVSDATGETAEKICQAALSQFADEKIVLARRHYIRSESQIEEVLQEAKARKGLIIFTFVSESLRLKIREGALQSGLLAVDLLGPLLTAMSHFLKSRPRSEPGRLHRIDTDYFSRVEAVQFTVKHDDGQNLQGVRQADIVLVGPSRTAKTPLSIYLAQFGYKVANIPIILNIPLPKEIKTIDPVKIVALIIDPQRLMEIREARLTRLNRRVAGYADMEAIIQELNYCREIYRQNPQWGIIDVSGRAVEEVATDIMGWIRRGDPFQ
ncbi:MAG: kinase/pyrophosphorylase [Nitrospirae bacterium]|nr:kinase/pyrophosphorylase [Candidatus Manganitrophaceae bacterium]